MIGLLLKAAKGIAAGNAQAQLGTQSPHLPGAIVRIGRFLYVVTAGWISISWYTAYANQRTQPGSGPTLVLPGTKPIVSPPDRPNTVPSFAANIFGMLNPGPAQVAGGAIGSAVGDITTAIAGAAGPVPGALGAYPGPIGRTDQGVDFSGTGPVKAILPGKVVYAGLWPGWPGTDGIVYLTKAGPIYVMEHFARAVNPATGKPFKVGDTVTQGQVIGSALRGYPYIETGFANDKYDAPATPYNGRPDGTPMPGGLAFRKLMGM